MLSLGTLPKDAGEARQQNNVRNNIFFIEEILNFKLVVK